MGLNLHHSIMINKKRQDSIPEYRYKSKYEACNEITMIQSLSKYNEILREAQRLLWYHKRNNGKSIEGIVSTIYNGFQSTMGTVVSATENLKQSMAESIDAAIIKDVESKSNLYTSLLSQFDKEQVICKYLSDSGTRPSLNIVDIHLGNIMNHNFPNSNILSNNKLFDDIKMMFLTHNNDMSNDNVSYNVIQSDDPDIRIGIMSNIVEEDRIKIISQLFDGYFYSEDNVVESARHAANIAFGNNISSEVDFSKELYAEACNNLANIGNIINGLEKNKYNYNRVYSEIIDKLQKLLVEVSDIIVRPGNAMDLHTRYQYGSVSTRIANALQSAINTIDSIINANYIVFAHKLSRICSIMDASYKIKSMGDAILHKYGKSSVSQEEYDRFNNASIFYGLDYTHESNDIINKLNIDLLLIHEMIEDNFLNKDRYSILLEADGDDNSGNNANDNKADQQQSTPAQNSNTRILPPITKENLPNSAKARQLAAKIMRTLSVAYTQVLNRFKQRFNELIIKNKAEQTFWLKNKEAVLQLGNTIGNTKVNEWYKYNIKDIMNFQSFQVPEFDSSNSIFKSNEAFVEFIISKVNGTALGITKDDSFAMAFTKIYQGGPMVNTTGGEELNKVGYNHNEVVDFVTRMTNGNLLSEISKDDRIIKQAQNRIQSQYDMLLNKINTSDNTNTGNNNTNAGNNTNSNDNNSNNNNATSTDNNTTTTQSNQESAMSYDNFSLAECFGLPQKNYYALDEASYEIDQATARQAVASGISTNPENSVALKNTKVLNDMIKRYMTILVALTSSRMTCAIGAYKQYSGLFKAIRNKKVDNIQ